MSDASVEANRMRLLLEKLGWNYISIDPPNDKAIIVFTKDRCIGEARYKNDQYIIGSIIIPHDLVWFWKLANNDRSS